MNSEGGLGADLTAFIREHEYCGELDTSLEGDLFQLTCSCGAALVRRLEPVLDQEIP